jgi:hypothetical protein
VPQHPHLGLRARLQGRRGEGLLGESVRCACIAAFGASFLASNEPSPLSKGHISAAETAVTTINWMPVRTIAPLSISESTSGGVCGSCRSG